MSEGIARPKPPLPRRGAPAAGNAPTVRRLGNTAEGAALTGIRSDTMLRSQSTPFFDRSIIPQRQQQQQQQHSADDINTGVSRSQSESSDETLEEELNGESEEASELEGLPKPPGGRPPPPKPNRRPISVQMSGGPNSPNSNSNRSNVAAPVSAPATASASPNQNRRMTNMPAENNSSPTMSRNPQTPPKVPTRTNRPTRQFQGAPLNASSGSGSTPSLSSSGSRPLPKPGEKPSPQRTNSLERNSSSDLDMISTSPTNGSELDLSLNSSGPSIPPRLPQTPDRPPAIRKRGVTRKSVPTGAKPTVPKKPEHMKSSSGPLLDFSTDEIRSLMRSLKKLTGANVQLVYVAKLTQSILEEKGQAESGMLKNQLTRATEALDSSNKQWGQDVKNLQKNEDQETIRNLIRDAATVAHCTEALVAITRKVTVEIDDDKTFERNLLAFNTATTAMSHLVSQLEQSHGELDDDQIKLKLSESARKIEAYHYQLVSSRADNAGALIGPGRRSEIEAATRAAIAAVWKLVQSFRGPIQQHIVIEAKVSACTISQLEKTLIEITKNSSSLSHKHVREMIEQDAAAIKDLFQELMTVTKSEVANPTTNTPDILEKACLPLFDHLKSIISKIAMCSRLDSVATQLPAPSDADKAVAERVCAVPETLIIPGPKEEPQEATDESVKDIDNIWDEPPDSDENIVIADGQVKCGTLNKLVERLTSPVFHDLNYMKTFITTYRSFTTPSILLTKLIQRYHVPESARLVGDKDQTLPIQLRVCNVLRQWVENQHQDFGDSLIQQLNEFVEMVSEDNASYKKFASTITATLQKKQQEANQAKSEIIKLKIEAKIPLSASNCLFLFDEQELARQLTLVEFAIYSAIQPVELMNQNWNKAKYKYRSPNVLSLIQRSTRLTLWIASVILWQPTLKERIRALTKIINIAEHLRKMNNFNSLIALISALNMSPIHRLKFTREGISQQSKDTLVELERQMDCNSNYSNYRKELHTVDPPCVPFLGVFLTDLTFTDDGNPDLIGGLINYKKRQMVYKTVTEIQTYQQIGYNFNLVDNIAHFLTELPYIDDPDQMYQLSLILEPRNASIDDIV